MFWIKTAIKNQNLIYKFDFGIHIHTLCIYICFALDLNDKMSLDETCYEIAVWISS